MSINTSDSGSRELESDPDSQLGSLSVASPDNDAPAELDLRIPSIIAQSQAAFRRDLAQLLVERAGQWVAYHGDEQIGFGRTKTELYQDCLRRGFKRDEFLVRSIEHELDLIVLSPRALG